MFKFQAIFHENYSISDPAEKILDKDSFRKLQTGRQTIYSTKAKTGVRRPQGKGQGHDEGMMPEAMRSVLRFVMNHHALAAPFQLSWFYFTIL